MSYTQKEEQIIRNNNPVTYEKAEELASQFGKTVRSVISKAGSLEVYQKRQKPLKVDRPQKKDTVRSIEKVFGLEVGELQGLNNARGDTLNVLFRLIAEAVR